MTPVLTIWGRTNSVNVQKVLWCAAELGIAFERRDAGLAFGKNDEPWYLALNPHGRVPLLVDGDFSLWESNTIVRYLCAKHDFGGLYPETLEERALVERWMDWQLATLARPLRIVFWGLVRAPQAGDPAQIRAAAAELVPAFTVLDGHLARHAYVAGERFTMGDIPVGALAHRWLALEGIERPELPALRRWHESLAARPAFRAHVMLPLS